MRKAIVCSLALMVCAATASANLVVNGDWNTGNETGWTRWNSPWGGPFSWSVDATDGQPAPSGKLSAAGGSFGWYQWVPTNPGTIYTISGDWKGQNVGWAEIIFGNDDGRSEYDQLDAPVANNIVSKEDGGATYGWQPIDPSSKGSGAVTQVATGPRMLVGLKLGQSGGGQSTAWYDNIAVTPEPATAILLGLPILLLRRRR